MTFMSGGTWDVVWDELGLDTQPAVGEGWGLQTPQVDVHSLGNFLSVCLNELHFYCFHVPSECRLLPTLQHHFCASLVTTISY